jgi:DNA-binding transcriptional ArsR family regulator
MDLNTAANALRELGHPTRLSIYRELVRAGHEGLPVGELQKHLEIPASTLSHHLSADIRWTHKPGTAESYPVLQALLCAA